MRKRILLVDDSPTILMMEEQVIQQIEGYECLTAQNGAQAVELALAECPDLILMDVVMPEMNGFEACKRMREHARLQHTPVILVTTHAEEEYVEAGFQGGCNDYINKPIESAELLPLLHSYLGE
jgi:CheY-like chemotaxis protein